MIKRDMFQKRLEENKPIYLSEFLYPLMQGYDSVHLQVDVELCGNDQMFNALAGRHLSQEILNKDKFVLTGKLLTTADGKKMGKSEGNMIKLTDSAEDMYGKVMSFPDEHIIPGFELLTNSDLEEIEEYKEQMKTINPMELKKKLAYTITSELHSEEEAQKAQQYFESIFQNKDFNTEIREVKVTENQMDILSLIVEKAELSSSKSQARRLVEQSAVSINGEKETDSKKIVDLSKEVTLKVGKQIVKIVK
jgi:tyrosyl-tRNA synthetase